MVSDGTLGSVAGVVETVVGTLGRLAGAVAEGFVTLEKISLRVVRARRVWVLGGGSKGRC